MNYMYISHENMNYRVVNCEFAIPRETMKRSIVDCRTVAR